MKHMKVKVFLANGITATISNMDADDFQKIIIEADSHWISSDHVNINLGAVTRGCINTDQIVCFIEQRD